MHQTISLQSLYYCNHCITTMMFLKPHLWLPGWPDASLLHISPPCTQQMMMISCSNVQFVAKLHWAGLCIMALNEIQNVQYSKSEGTSPHWEAQLHDDSMWSLKRCTLCLVNCLAWNTHWYPMTCCLLTAWCAELQTTFSPDHWSLPWRLSLSRPLTPSPCIRTVIWFCSVVRV